MLKIWSSRERNRSFAPLVSVFFGRIDALLDAATESRIEAQRNPQSQSKSQDFHRQPGCLLQNRGLQPRQNRFSISGFAVIRGRLTMTSGASPWSLREGYRLTGFRGTSLLRGPRR